LPAFFIDTTMTLDKLKSSIYNNVMSGLRGASINNSFTLEQIEDGIIQERLSIIKEYAAKNLIPIKDLMYSIRCIEVDCESLDRCCCDIRGTVVKHIEIPQIFNDFGQQAIDYMGSTDGLVSYVVYTDNTFKVHKYKRRGANDPYVWVDITPNQNGMYDAFIFNASPMLSNMLVRIIPKDIRQLEQYECCPTEEISNISFIDTEIEKRMTEKYIRYYRQMALAITPNDQTVKV
jgi:hypothetical protein